MQAWRSYEINSTCCWYEISGFVLFFTVTILAMTTLTAKKPKKNFV